jgi:hypothetical protein
MTDDDIIHALAAALVAHPNWEQPRHINIFALSEQDAAVAARDAFGEECSVLACAFRSDVLASLQAIEGKKGFWISGDSGVEMFAECELEDQARALFGAAMGEDAKACVSVESVVGELARMDEAINGKDPAPLASKSFLALVAAQSYAPL